MASVPFAAPASPVTVSPAVHAQAPSREPEKFPAERAPGLDLESQVAGKWLNYVGIVALLFATAFFIKYAFDNGWVGPRGRVAIGLLAGAALLLWSKRLLRRGYKYFSEGIAGLGAAVLYLSVWGGWNYYRIFSSGQAFAGMVVVTGVMIAVALRRNSQRIAMLALAGGFLTPELVSTGTDHEIVLFTYCAILSAGMLALERARSWKWLPSLAFAATEIYYWGWYNEFYTPEKLGKTLAFAALFFVVFAALPLIRSRREGRIADTEYFIAVGNVLVFLLALQQMLWPEYRWGLTTAYLALAALHFVAARTLPQPKPGMEDATLHLRWLFAGLALLCISLAIPARLDHQWLTMSWAAEGVMLVWYGVRVESWKLRAGGLVFFVITAIRLLVLPIPAGRFLGNDRFFTYAIAVACFSVSCRFVQKIRDQQSTDERAAFLALAVGANVYALIALSLELWDLCGRRQIFSLSHFVAQQLSLVLLWALFGAGLIFMGLKRNSRLRRWPGIVLLLIAAIWLLALEIPAPTFLWNIRFLAYAIIVACLATCCRLARRLCQELSKGEQRVFSAVAVGVNLYTLIALSLEVWDLFGRTQALGLERWLAQQLGLSVLWTLYAGGLIAIGLARRSPLLRWQALALFSLVVAKVFLYDMSSLDRIYRIISFLVLGLLLMGVSFAYQRRAMANKAPNKS